MKFIICDSTHFFQLEPFIENYKAQLSKLNYKIIDKTVAAKEFDLKNNDRLSDAFDYHTDQGCMVEVNDLASLSDFSHAINKDAEGTNFFIDMEARLIVLTDYYPDD